MPWEAVYYENCIFRMLLLEKMKRKILLVDDDEMILFSLECALTMEGFTVITALHGKAALEIIIAHEARRHPISCIIVDLHMPAMSGLELIDKVQKLKIRIPIMVLSATPREELEKELSKIGISSFREKPVSIQNLVNGVHEILSP